jgi:hypothetical protein
MPRKSLVQLSLGLALAFATDLAGRPGLAQVDQPWRCLKWDGRACDAQDLTSPGAHQLLILSSGYSAEAAEHFWRDLDVLIRRMTGEEAGRAWSAQKRDKLFFVGHFTGGGSSISSSASFGARVIVDPGGRHTLAVQISDVHAFVDALHVDHSWLLPTGTAVLVQSSADTAGASAHAAPPSFLGKSYGVAVFSSEQVRAGSYTPVHELAHATLNFLDEYVEAGLETRSLGEVDAFREQLVLDQSWGGRGRPERSAWDLRLVEILAGNGPVNLSPYRDVSSVRTPGSKPERYEYEGGLFLGRGSYHDAGSNLMNSPFVRRTPHDDFALDHSPAQLLGMLPTARTIDSGMRDPWTTGSRQGPRPSCCFTTGTSATRFIRPSSTWCRSDGTSGTHNRRADGSPHTIRFSLRTGRSSFSCRATHMNRCSS